MGNKNRKKNTNKEKTKEDNAYEEDEVFFDDNMPKSKKKKIIKSRYDGTRPQSFNSPSKNRPQTGLSNNKRIG
jgi:hypothetical protein